jgi:hypothetical protein
MTDTHVVSALKEKRTQVASQIESLYGMPMWPETGGVYATARPTILQILGVP